MSLLSTSNEKLNKTKAIFQKIHADLEPGVINHEMLNEAILEQGYKGEAFRLSRLNPIKYENITIIRLEFVNLLKIDHLWVLPNLEKLSLKFNKLDKIENIEMLTKLNDLDLSFNFIEKIEKLDTLVNLEVLSLFNNRIRRLENLDSLEKILILSVGNNLIDTFDGIDRLRFMKELRSLDLEGNPITQMCPKEVTFHVYISAFLPNLKYYNYVYIDKKERQQGQNIFKIELQLLEEKQLAEVNERKRIAKELDDERRLSSSFVELLNEHQLFDSFFADDVDGKNLLSIGGEADNLVKEFREEVYQITQQIYKLGLEKHEIRLKEISLFDECISQAKLKSQQHGIEMINDFLQKESELFNQTKVLIKRIKNEYGDSEINNIDGALKQQIQNVQTLTDLTWHVAMEEEIQLFEDIDEANTQFGVVIMDMLNEFIDQTQNLFVQIRDAEINFSDAMYEMVSQFITEKNASDCLDAIPEGLKECIEDKDAIINFNASSRDYHMQIIDAREDRLVTRARTWVQELIASLQSDEISRNRSKVMEINYFLDQHREMYDKFREDTLLEEDE